MANHKDISVAQRLRHRQKAVPENGCGLFFFLQVMEDFMETRVALIGIIVENTDSTPQLNQLLHEYGDFIIGRMGIPYRERGVHVISVVIDAPQDAINALSGKIGRLSGITAKTVYSNVAGKAEQTDLSALQAVVSGKADQSTVSDLTSTRNCRVYYKTYTGSGSGNCSFTFPAKPMIVMVMGGGYWLCLLQGQSEGQSRNAVTRSTYIDTVWSGNSVTWSINDVDLQCNRKDTTYSLVAVLQV